MRPRWFSLAKSVSQVRCFNGGAPCELFLKPLFGVSEAALEEKYSFA